MGQEGVFVEVAFKMHEVHLHCWFIETRTEDIEDHDLNGRREAMSEQ